MSARSAGSGEHRRREREPAVPDPVVALPIRSFRDAYRRLAVAYDPPSRAFLARSLATHTADVVEEAGIAPLIVSSAPDVRDWAARRSHDVLADPPGGGLNGAASEVVGYAGRRPWLILHSDLPCLTSEEVREALRPVRAGRQAVAFSYDGGTSALGGSGPFPFSYGVGSFHRHLHAGRRPSVVVSLGFALDIDRPDDLSVAAGHPRGAWLAGLGFG